MSRLRAKLSWFSLASTLPSLLAVWAAPLIFAACGGAETPPPATAVEAAPAPPPAPSVAPPAAAEPAPAAPAEAAKPAEPAEKAEEAPAADSARNVKYIVNPDGMRVEIEGLSFAPKAEAVKAGAGYAIKLKVEVKTKDDESHSLLAPAQAEVAMAGSIRRAGQAEPETFGDKREGDREIVVKGAKPVTLTRTWPGAGGPKPLVQGDEAELMVGIWGVGADAASRRPLKKFCKITVKFTQPKPRVVVSAPDGISK